MNKYLPIFRRVMPPLMLGALAALVLVYVVTDDWREIFTVAALYFLAGIAVATIIYYFDQ